MGRISTGIGLVSGMDIGSIVDQLMQIERRPVQLAQRQLDALDSQKKAFLELTTRLLTAKAGVAVLNTPSIFSAKDATSSDESILSARADSNAPRGSYSFLVRRLATNHQMVSSGFADTDRQRVGAGSISFEIGHGHLNPPTLLDQLNGGNGVRPGKIRITDRTGTSVVIDFSSATDVSDVLEAINSQTTLQVDAAAEGDRLVLTDRSGATTSDLIVEDVDGGRMADDLGILGRVAGRQLVGEDRYNLAAGTLLDRLNNGTGVRRARAGGDMQITLANGTSFQVDLSGRLQPDTQLSLLNGGNGIGAGTIRIHDRSGATAEVDLSTAQTAGDVVAAINDSGLSINAVLVGDHFTVSDTSGQDDSELVIEDLAGGSTAQDLGIAGSSSDGSITGTSIYGISTVGDVIRQINTEAATAIGAGVLEARIAADGNRLELIDSTGGSGPTVAAIGESAAAEDLGLLGTGEAGVLTGSAVLAGLNTVLLKGLNGGAGVDRGVIRIADRAGGESLVDLTGAETLQDVLDAINGASTGANVRAELNESANGIVVRDLTGATGGNLVISDVSGTTAQDLGIAIDQAAEASDSGNLQLQYVSRATPLSELNGGEGVAAGRFRIYDSSGTSALVDLSQGNEQTVGDVIDEINSRGIGVAAAINATGDGIVLTDTAGGPGQLRVVEDGGSTAADLRLLGQADPGETTIDGSFEYRIQVDAGDTLADLAGKINDLGAPVTADIINDGTGSNPYRLTLRSTVSGSQGAINFDGGATALEMSTLTQAQDAVVQLGGAGGGLRAVSSTNVVTDFIPGLKLDLVSTGNQPVTVTVTESTDRVVELARTMVESLDAVLDKVGEFTKYDAENNVRGPLFADATAQRIESSIYRVLQSSGGVPGRFSRLHQVGIEIAEKGRVRFDEGKLRAALQEDPAGVTAFFTDPDQGMAKRIEDVLEALTTADGGTIVRRTDTLDNQTKLINERIDRLQGLLDRKQERLFRQFQAMESALAQMQSQSTALASLPNLSAPTSNSPANL